MVGVGFVSVAEYDGMGLEVAVAEAVGTSVLLA